MEFKVEDQYKSMIRAYNLLQKLAIDIGERVFIGDQTPLDRAKDFFNQCYHLKDWLKKDSRIKHPQEIEDMITNSKALSLAADICNSFKHAGLEKPPRSGMYINQINMDYSLDISNLSGPGSIKVIGTPSVGDTIRIRNYISTEKKKPKATAKLSLTVSGQKYDAIDIATQCIEEWDLFLESQNLVFPKT
jgi:hypothetical protein